MCNEVSAQNILVKWNVSVQFHRYVTAQCMYYWYCPYLIAINRLLVAVTIDSNTIPTV